MGGVCVCGGQPAIVRDCARFYSGTVPIRSKLPSIYALSLSLSLSFSLLLSKQGVIVRGGWEREREIGDTGTALGLGLLPEKWERTHSFPSSVQLRAHSTFLTFEAADSFAVVCIPDRRDGIF
jgi:hypothetical protein